MGWRDLIEGDGQNAVAPWFGGRSLHVAGRTCTLIGKQPSEPGWYSFCVRARRASLLGPAQRPDALTSVESLVGYLVGDRIVRDDVRVDPNPAKIVDVSEPVYLLEDGIDRFARVRAVRLQDGDPLVFAGVEMPLGPEEAVLNAYLDQKPSVDDVPGVPSALDAAFRMESWQRAEAERRRAEIERAAREEEERRQREERRKEIEKSLGTGVGRRELAGVDFAAAAKAALAISGAVYLDHRRSARRGEMIVRYRLINRRFECVCDERTLRIISSGICLTAHYDDLNFTEGTCGDTWFTLESLPAIVMQAHREGKLVVFRHAD